VRVCSAGSGVGVAGVELSSVESFQHGRTDVGWVWGAKEMEVVTGR
jgi:hypothetical protein